MRLIKIPKVRIFFEGKYIERSDENTSLDSFVKIMIKKINSGMAKEIANTIKSLEWKQYIIIETKNSLRKDGMGEKILASEYFL